MQYWSEEEVDCPECEKEVGDSEEDSSVSDRHSRSHSSSPGAPTPRLAVDIPGKAGGGGPESKGDSDPGIGGEGGGGERKEGEKEEQLGGVQLTGDAINSSETELQDSSAEANALAGSSEQLCGTTQPGETQDRTTERRTTPLDSDLHVVLPDNEEPHVVTEGDQVEPAGKTIQQQAASKLQEESCGPEDCLQSLQALTISNGQTGTPESTPLDYEEGELTPALVEVQESSQMDCRVPDSKPVGPVVTPRHAQDGCQAPPSLPPHPLLCLSDREEDGKLGCACELA